MNIGKLIRLNRLFAHPSGKFCSVAIDHFNGYGDGLPAGLRKIKPTLAAIVARRTDRQVYFRADRAVPYGFVVKVIAEVRNAGVEKLGMVTEPLER